MIASPGRPIHIEGMGWFGAATALALERAGLSFTWSDADHWAQAWKASTGLVYPAGDDRSEANRHRWIRWVLEDSWVPNGTAKLCAYAFAHLKPPHEGRYETERWQGLRMGASMAVCVNAAAIVHEARSRFADRRDQAPDPRARTIIAHSGARRVGWVWGWSRKVSFTGYEHPAGVALYGKRHRFDLTYAYPVPDEPGWWWAGSALVNERRPRQREAVELQAQWVRWDEARRVLFPQMVVNRTQPIQQGWRPKPATGDDGMLLVTRERLQFPALWHSGVRWAPELIEGAVRWAATR